MFDRIRRLVPALPPFKTIVLLYLLFGTLWVLLSDVGLALLVRDIELLRWLQVLTDEFFVGASALLLYGLLSKHSEQMRRALAARSVSENEVREIIASISDYLYVNEVDAEGRWRKRYTSPHAKRLIGYSDDELVADWNLWLEQIHPQDQPAAQRQVERFERGEDSEVEYRLYHRDGSMRWVRDSGRVVPRAGGGYIVYGIVSDVTARKRGEVTLRRQDRLLHAVATATQHLVTRRHLHSAMSRAVAALGEALDVDHVHVCEHRRAGHDEIIVARRWRWSNAAQSGAFTVAAWLERVLGQVALWEQLERGEVVRLRPQPDEQDERQRRVLLVPIFSGRRYWGYLELDSARQAPRWSGNEQAILQAMCATIGGVFERAAAETALRQAEARNRALLNAMPDRMFRLSRSGTFLDFSASTSPDAYLSDDWKEIVGRSVMDVFPEPVARQLLYYIERALQTGQIQIYEYDLYHPDHSRTYEARLVISGEDEVLAIVRDMTRQRQAERTIHYQTRYDSLTGLLNRFSFGNLLANALMQARRNGKQVAIFLLDLDRFKLINDTLGHSIGDRMLQRTARRLEQILGEHDVVARLSGDEFGIVLPDLERRQQAVDMAQRVLEGMRPPIRIDEHDLFITPSIGVSFYPTDGRDPETLLRNAEVAMYRVKDQGRNGYRLYSALMDATSFDRLALENSLRLALERNEFLLHYQPIVDIATWQIVGCEALVRWQHPTRGMMEPQRWIPIAEETGLILPIGSWVLRTACKQGSAWQAAGHPLRIAVNLSALQFQQDDLVDQVRGVLAATGLPPACLDLEITENIIMQDNEKAESQQRELRALGVHLAIDDFGTGYSSLNYLKRFSVNMLKIDRSFVCDLAEDSHDAAIVKAIVAVGHSLNLRVLAEGVESVEQLAFLRALQCDEMQGYLFSPPLPPDAFLRLLLRHQAERV